MWHQTIIESASINLKLFSKMIFLVAVLANCAVFVLLYPEFRSAMDQSAEVAPPTQATSEKLLLVSEMPAGFFSSQAKKVSEAAVTRVDDLSGDKAIPIPNPAEQAVSASDLSD